MGVVRGIVHDFAPVLLPCRPDRRRIYDIEAQELCHRGGVAPLDVSRD